MGLKAINVFLLIALSIYLIQSASALPKPKPRDSYVVHDKSVVPINNEHLSSKQDFATIEEAIRDSTKISTSEVKIPGRIPCEFEEAAEDTVCQEHCLPKGYSYGICVSHTCSCI